MENHKSICKRIIEKWGREAQINKIQEEALELALALSQRNCPTKDPKAVEDALYDELADMKIMMMQAELLFDAERIAKRVQYKLDRVVSKHLGPLKKDLEYYRNNAEEDYLTTPISVLRYIKKMEQALRIHNEH